MVKMANITIFSDPDGCVFDCYLSRQMGALYAWSTIHYTQWHNYERCCGGVKPQRHLIARIDVRVILHRTYALRVKLPEA